jgi:hypothetical protein
MLRFVLNHRRRHRFAGFFDGLGLDAPFLDTGHLDGSVFQSEGLGLLACSRSTA